MDKKKVLTVFVMFLFFTLLFSGCTQQGATLDEDTEKFYGRWLASENDVHVFFQDGSCIYLDIPGTFVVQNGQVSVTLRTGQEYNYDYWFTENNSKLILQHSARGYTTVYEKQS